MNQQEMFERLRAEASGPSLLMEIDVETALAILVLLRRGFREQVGEWRRFSNPADEQLPAVQVGMRFARQLMERLRAVGLHVHADLVEGLQEPDAAELIADIEKRRA